MSGFNTQIDKRDPHSIASVTTRGGVLLQAAWFDCCSSVSSDNRLVKKVISTSMDR